MNEQLQIITLYAIIGVSIATVIVFIIRYFMIKYSQKKTKQAKIIRYHEYLEWRKKFHNDFVKIEREWK